jgi:sulfur relay (sulfurtransferase) DsrC/TusE family protein
MQSNVGGKELETDEEGYLVNLNEWEPDVATSWLHRTTWN